MESYKRCVMIGGIGQRSYSRNSLPQRNAIDATKVHIQRAVATKLELDNFRALETFRIADLGCSIGPNTFLVVENILDAVKLKYKLTHEPNSTKVPEFQVFFNDHSMNDFNTLFGGLPPHREYYASGVPGSFYSRLFPRASLHFVHSSTALQWLSQVPKEVADRRSTSWNKGRIHLLNAREEVAKAFSMQHATDLTNFLTARAEEVVPGGLMVITVPARPNGTPHAQARFNMVFDMLGSCLMELSSKGLVDEEKVDSFNIPQYCTSPQEVEAVIEQNGCFSIESMVNQPTMKNEAPLVGHRAREFSLVLRACTEELIKEHFGPEILDQLFDLFTNKIVEAHQDLAAAQQPDLFLLLKRKTHVKSDCNKVY